MAERSRPKFGDKLPQGGRSDRSAELFPAGDDLPIFSGTPQEVVEHPFVPEDHSMKQTMLPGMPDIDYDHVREKDRQRRHGKPVGGSGSGTLWSYDDALAQSTSDPASEEPARHLREALAAYHLNARKLRSLAAMGAELTEAIKSGEPPPEVVHLLVAISALFRPTPRERIRSPLDAAAIFMLEMSHLDQEQLRVMCLNTKNQIQNIHIVYQGNVNASIVRPAEIFREPLRLNSVGIILAHNHSSGEPDPPSPEDVLMTREIVAAGKLLEVEVLDHLIIGQGKWLSLRQRGLGFDK